MSILENIIYGLISGMAEFLPVSSSAHQVMLRYMFGIESRNFLQEFLVHTGLLLAVLISCRDSIIRFSRQNSIFNVSKRKNKRKPESVDYYSFRLLKTAIFPLVIGLILLFITIKTEDNLLAVVGFFVINALILFLAAHSQQGNRDARSMTGLDGIIMGLLGCLSVFPGISRTAAISSYTTLRGADLRNSVNWTFLLGIPAILFLIIFDVIGLASVGLGVLSFSAVIGYILSGIVAFCSGYFAISVLFIILSHSGFSCFAYYSLGSALFTFILYLIT